jgi:hypothetical protein
MRILPLLAGCGLLAGCVAFGPGVSMTNPRYFSESPYIVARADGYSLCWRYGTLGFYFYPESRVMNDQLVFSLQGTSSTGSTAGKYGEMPLTGSGRIHALESGGAFWHEPDGGKVQLEVRRMISDKPLQPATSLVRVTELAR